MITVKAIYSSGTIIPEEVDKLRDFKKSLDDGTVVEITFKKWESTRSDRAFRYFHALLNRYSKSLGLDMLAAKDETCLQAGVWIPYNDRFQPPTWGGHFIEYQGEIYFRKTTNEYTVPEMCDLIKYLLMACQANGVDVDDLLIENKDWYGRKIT